MNNQGKIGPYIESAHCELLERNGYVLMRSAELDNEEKIDYIITEAKDLEVKQPFEAQITTKTLSLAKFEKFVSTRDRDRVAISAYIVITGVNLVEESVNVVQRMLELLNGQHLLASEVLVIELERGTDAVCCTAEQYRDVLMNRRARTVPVDCTIIEVERRQIRARTDHGRTITTDFDEIEDRKLVTAWEQHMCGQESLIGRVITTNILAEGNYGIRTTFSSGEAAHAER